MCFVSVDFFFFKQKTAYEMRISDWSSDVCSSDLISSVEARVGKGVSGPSGARRMPCLCQIRPCGGQDDWITNPAMAQGAHCLDPRREHGGDRKSVVSGKRVSVRVDLGGRRIIKKKKQREQKRRRTSKKHRKKNR